MVVYLVIFAAVVVLVLFIFEAVIPFFMERYNRLHDKRATEFSARLEDSFLFWEKKKMFLFYLSPFIFAGLGLVLSRHIIGLFAGFVVGFAVPNVIINIAKRQRLKNSKVNWLTV